MCTTHKHTHIYTHVRICMSFSSCKKTSALFDFGCSLSATKPTRTASAIPKTTNSLNSAATSLAASNGSNSHQNGTRMPQEGSSGPAVLASSMLHMHDSTQSSGTEMLFRNTVARIVVDSHTPTYESHAQYVRKPSETPCAREPASKFTLACVCPPVCMCARACMCVYIYICVCVCVCVCVHV
jgi:hypothetical protein